MKLLIVTSEYLYEGYTLGSTFELSQAKILSQKFDVAILSVSVNDSLLASVKAIFKNNLPGSNQQKQGKILKRLSNAASAVLFKKKIVTKYNIEEINTYEGAACALFSYGTFKKQFSVWLRAGLNAFESYCRDNGKPDIIHAHGRFLNAGALALNIKKKYGIQYVYTEHSTFYQQGIAPPEAIPILRNVIAECKVYITVSIALEKQVERYLGQPVQKACIIPNVIDPVFESPLQDIAENENTFTFITVASLEYKKGHDLLIRAFAAAFNCDSKYKLVIVGDGPLRHELTMLVLQSGLNNNVHFTGNLPKQEVLAMIDKANGMVLASRVETFGVVVIEALSRGLPVIATRSGGPEYIVEESCGILIEPEDEGALSNALTTLANNIHLYKKETIRANALKKFGTHAFLSQMEKVYNTAIYDLHH